MLIEKQNEKSNAFGLHEIVKVLTLENQLGTIVGFSGGKYKVKVNNTEILVEETEIQKRSLLLS